MLGKIINYLKKLLKKDRNELPMEEIRIADNLYTVKIPNETIEKWNKERRKKDKVEKIINRDGIYFKPQGRDGIIYYVKNKRICEVYFEMSGVREYDILINPIENWSLPEEIKLTSEERIEIISDLKLWLQKKRIKADI